MLFHQNRDLLEVLPYYSPERLNPANVPVDRSRTSTGPGGMERTVVELFGRPPLLVALAPPPEQVGHHQVTFGALARKGFAATISFLDISAAAA